jgi:hypothetical protein
VTEPGPDDSLLRLELELFAMAVHLLRRKGRFWPFGAVVWSDGECQLAAAPVETGERFPPAQTLRDRLIEELRAEAAAGRIQAAGLAADAREVEVEGRGVTNAVRLDVESVDGRAEVVHLSYERFFPRRYRIDPRPVRSQGHPLVFG